MLLKKLEMCGFKSFADKTEFDFQAGVTAFVGPNGCGKSNVVDAVRWILGEQSAKAVRGTQMADVIFNGTSNRRSLGFAEASLTFLNDRGILPVEYTEVCVTRRLYRSGESEYFLNRQPCRLRDIRTLFMDTGVGVDTYSIIEQGKVDKFIQSNSKERRAIFEEAAGISKYKAQRREAQSRLERTRLNLQKVDIRLEEQRKQLRSIKYQAAKARRYREHTARLRELVIGLSVKNYREWEARRSALELEIGALDTQQAAIAGQLSQIEQLTTTLDARIAELENEHLRKREGLHTVQSGMEAAEASIAHNGELIHEYQDENERCTRSTWSLAEKLRQTQDEMSEAERNLQSIRETIERQAQSIAAETQKADAAGGECERLAAAIEEWKNRTIQIIERATTLRNELNHMDSSRRQQLARRARLQGQLAEKTAEVERMDQEIRALTGERDEISGRLADRSLLLHEKERELVRLDTEAQELESKLRDQRHREAQCISRREILQDLEVRGEDIESGVKRLLRNDGQGPELHVRGMVANLVRAELRYALAVEAALGDSAQYIITSSETEAGAAVALLRTDRSGRAGLIPLNRARAQEAEELHLAGEDGVLGRAADLVRYSPELEPVIRHLLGGAWIVKDLATALRLSGNGGARARFVTLDGDRVDPSGVILGGEPLPRAGIISRKSELDEIERELRTLSETLAILEGQRGRVTEQVESLRGDVATLRKEIEQGNLAKLSNENEILNRRKRQKLLGDESATIRSEMDEIEAAVKAFDERERVIEQELNETLSQRDRLQAEMDAARRNLADQQAVVDRLRQELTRLKVELAEKEVRRGGFEKGIVTARQTITEVEAQIASIRQRMEELRLKQAQAETEITQARANLVRLGEEKSRVTAEIEAVHAEQQAAQTSRAELAEKARALRADLERLRQQLQKLRIEEQEFRVRMESLVERVFGEHGVRLPDVLADHPPAAPETDWAAIAQEIEELREKVRRMGGVNEESIDEENSLEIGIAETEAQRNDLVKATEDLQEVIRKLNKVSREKFMQTFEEVRKNFQETFRRLFGGGRCDITLEAEEPDVLEAGIEVLACPPGKELRSITLLSGGEKTMTTIALLFAVFRSKPSPFCILDEVDAALDEANIDRFTQMLVDEFVKDSQFIIITHSKRTVGIAEVLYGITMQEKGISKKVAVKVEDVTGMLN